MPSLTTLTALQNAAIDRADLTGAAYVTSALPALNQQINFQNQSLYDLLVGSYETYYKKLTPFQTANNVALYPVSFNVVLAANPGAFTTGLTATGATSGASGTIRTITTNQKGQTVLGLSDLSFTAGGVGFTASETITDTLTGSGTYSSASGCGAADFFKLLGIDLYFAAGSNTQWITCYPFEFEERNRVTYPYLPFPFTASNINYRYGFFGQDITIAPTPTTAVQFQMWYVPTYKPLVNGSDTFDDINGWSRYTVLGAAAYLRGKQQQDNSDLLAEQQQVKSEILAIRANRDVGLPHRIVDSTSTTLFPGASMMGTGWWY
jgi:hypothetical protein